MPQILGRIDHLAIGAVRAAAPSTAAPADASASREIEGTIVPWGVAAAVGMWGDEYRFAEGSLTPARERSPMLLEHNRERSIGVLESHASDASGLSGTWRIDATADGDLALETAASGSRSGLSAGFEVLRYTIDAAGVIDVLEAALHETSLVTIPAYDARVARVAATGPGGHMPDAAATQTSAILEAAPAATTQPPVTGEPAALALTAAAPERPVSRDPIIVADRPALPLTATELVRAMLRAERGDAEARAIVQAAMAPPSLTVDNPGVLPITYTQQILGELPAPRPLFDVAAHPPLPAAGMQIDKPIWTTLPDGGWMADDAAEPVSVKAAIGTKPVAIKQWAAVVETSEAVLNRSSPNWVDAWYRAAIKDYYLDVETLLVAQLPAGPGTLSVGGTAGAIARATRVAPDLLVVSTDQWGVLFDALGMLLFTSGAAGVSGGALTGTWGGLKVVVGAGLPDATVIVGTSSVLEMRESTPLQLSAVLVGAMKVQLGVTAFASVDNEQATAFAHALPLDFTRDVTPPAITRGSK